MQEIWKDIEGYDGEYQVSNLGNIRSRKKCNNYAYGTWHNLSPNITRGYVFIALRKNNKSNNHLVHRLVAKAFIENPNNYNEINHKDENKLNNNVENLEWCSREYNMSYGTARIRQGISYGKPIEQITIDGITIAKYCSAEIASKLLNIDGSSIHKCCNGSRKYAGGYKWRYITSSKSI